MEVSHIEDSITHAVVSSRAPREATISQDAAFFKVMASSLYSDKKLAVVREILCNAWDAHIEAGVTNIPVEVTIDESSMEIRDFGNGIPDDKIQGTYLTFGGGSNKAANNMVTGGFALGSKAPWAYVDHFQVVSCSQGVKTGYSMTFSNAEVGGKPAAIPLFSVPTDETGMSVSLEIKDQSDKYSFLSLVQQIAGQGEMLVKLNGQLLKTIPFSRMTENFALLSKDFFPTSHTLIRVRYGNVIYPLDVGEGYGQEHKQAVELLDKLGNNNRYGTQWVLVLQAPPGSIAITPSRESLSLTDKTISVIKQLLTEFVQKITGIVEADGINLAREAASKTWLVGAPHELIHASKMIPNLRRIISPKNQEEKLLSDPRKIARQYLHNNYPVSTRFRRQELTSRLDTLIEAGADRMGFFAKFRKELLETPNPDGTAGPWFHKKIVWPIIKQMLGNKHLDPDAFGVYVESRYHWERDQKPITPAKKFHAGNTIDYFPILRGHIILAYSHRAIRDRADEFPALKHWLGPASRSFCYLAPRGKEALEEVRRFFKDMGFLVLDLTVRQSWEPEPVKVAAAPRKKTKKGIPKLSILLKENASPADLYHENAERIEKPEFIAKVTLSGSFKGFDPYYLNSTVSKQIITLWGDKGGAIMSATQRAKYQDIPDVSSWFPVKLIEEIENNPRIAQYLSHNRQHWGKLTSNRSYRSEYLVDVIFADNELSKHFGVESSLTERDKILLSVLGSVSSTKFGLGDLIKKLSDIKASPEGEKLEKAANTTYEISSLLNEYRFKLNLASSGTPEEVKTLTRKILITVLEG